MSKAPCVFCGIEANQRSSITIKNLTFLTPAFDCPQCGRYVLDERFSLDWTGNDNDAAFKIACLVQEKQLAKKNVFYGVLDDDFQPLDDNAGQNHITKHVDMWWRKNDLLEEFPKATEIVDRALANLARETKHPMDEVGIKGSGIEYLTFGRSTQAFNTLKYMMEMGLLKYTLTSGEVSFSISPKGWERIEHMSQSGVDSKQAFVAMWFDPKMDTFFDEGIKPAIKKAGFKCRCMNSHEHNNKICDEIVAEIRKSRFIIADFTGHRGGVYFEAGYAMGMGLPVIWLVPEKDKDKLHFDTRQFNHIIYKSAEELKRKLQNRIAATIH